jgi:hypothetical protein
LGEILLGLRFLVTRSHGMIPFIVTHGFQADLPHYLRLESIDLPFVDTDMSDKELA